MHMPALYKKIFYCFVLNISWAFLSTAVEYMINSDRENPQGILTIGGFIVVYALSFVSFLPRKRKLTPFLFFMLTFPVVFIIATFAVPLILSPESVYEPLMVLASSIVASTGIVLIVSQFFYVRRLFICISLVTVGAFGVVIFVIYSGWFDYEGNFKRILHPLALGYASWQFVTTTILAMQMEAKKEEGVAA